MLLNLLPWISADSKYSLSFIQGNPDSDLDTITRSNSELLLLINAGLKVSPALRRNSSVGVLKMGNGMENILTYFLTVAQQEKSCMYPYTAIMKPHIHCLCERSHST